MIVTPSGRTILDFGQNLVGWVRFTVDGPAGTVVTLRHAEVLEDGELGTRPLRNAEATDRYTLRGGGPETWEPTFTFHGFRYVEVDGWPSPSVDPADVHRGRDPFGLRAHGHVLVLERAARPAPRERRLGHARQLRRRPDRLPAARRAPRLDR